MALSRYKTACNDIMSYGSTKSYGLSIARHSSLFVDSTPDRSHGNKIILKKIPRLRAAPRQFKMRSADATTIQRKVTHDWRYCRQDGGFELVAAIKFGSGVATT
jgi:hypothetical protein